MERYTNQCGDGRVMVFLQKGGDVRWTFSETARNDHIIEGDFIDRLSEYEDTDLTPKEVVELVERYKRLAELARNLEDDLIMNVQESGACRCDYCSNNDVCKQARQWGMCTAAEFEWNLHSELMEALENENNR